MRDRRLYVCVYLYSAARSLLYTSLGGHVIFIISSPRVYIYINL